MTLAEETTTLNENAKTGARAETTLPEPLRRTFGQLVEDYAVCAKIHAEEVVIEYDVLADLVRADWGKVV
jgi:hypothetical protein